MSPLLRRKRTPETDGAEAPEPRTEVQAAALEDVPRPGPAGLAPEEDIGVRPDTRRRGRLRRRLRHVRRVRELMLRDIGGLVYEIHRTQDGTGAQAHQSELVRQKLDRLVELDLERRGLEDTLGDQRDTTVLREPGVGGTCPNCGAYFASDARFCAHCGVRAGGRGTVDAGEHPGGGAPREAELHGTAEPVGTAEPAGAAATAGTAQPAGTPEPAGQRTDATGRAAPGAPSAPAGTAR